MTCEQFKSQLHDYLDGALSAKEQDNLEAHAAACPECAKELSEMKEVLKLLKDLPIEPLPENFEANLHEALVRESAAMQHNPDQVHGEKPEARVNFKARFNKWQRGLSYAAAVFLVGIVGLGGAGSVLNNFQMKSADAAVNEELNVSYSGDNIGFAGAAEGVDANANLKMGAAPEAAADMAVRESATVEAPSVATQPQDAFSPEAIKRIQTAQVNLEVTAYQAAMDSLTNHVTNLGGYIENSQTGTYTQRIGGQDVTLHEGFVVLRVPAEQFQALQAAVGDLGKVVYSAAQVMDVTDQYRDTYNELKNLEVRETALRAIMAKAKTVTETIEVERELSSVRASINALGTQLKGWDRLVAMSTITVNLKEVRDTTSSVNPPQPGLFDRAREAFVNTINAMIESFEKLFVWTVGILPVALPVILLGGGGYWIYRRRAKRRAKAQG